METKWDKYEAWFYQVEGIGRQKMKRLEGVGVSFEELYRSNANGLHKIITEAYRTSYNGMRLLSQKSIDKDVDAILKAIQSLEVDELYNRMSRHNIYYVNYKSEEYPCKLHNIPDSPYAFYRKGMPLSEAESKPVLAIIGARLCSEYGKYMAREIGEMAAGLGFEVVSGLARGVDGIAQNAARLAGGEVTAVLGCGVDICYPPENKDIYDGILSNGRLISEYPPGTQPLAQNFPPRNRIISGLADAVIVVEAKKKSGTSITVDMALEQGRDVFVVPGRLTDPMSYGCNRLIGQGAQGIYDLMETLLGIRNTSLHKMDIKNEAIINMVDLHNAYDENDEYIEATNQREKNLESMILKSLAVKPKSVQLIYEDILLQKHISLGELQTTLIEMEMMGQIKEEGGKFTLQMQFT